MTSIRCTFLSLVALGLSALADTFGTGSSQFTIQLAEIDRAGKAGEPLSKPLYAGAVDCNCRTGTCEVSTSMVGIANPLGGLGIMVQVQGGTPPQSSGLAGKAVARFLIGRTEVAWAEWQGVRMWAPKRLTSLVSTT
jgi:hypothetical protein